MRLGNSRIQISYRMKILIGLLVASLVVLGNCRKIAKLRGDVPSFFFRKLKAWKKQGNCEYEKMKSIPAKISMTQMEKKLAHNIKIKLASDRHPFEKMELRLEITGISRARVQKMARRKYIANMQLVGDPLYRRDLTIWPTFGDDGLLELTLDITAIANNASMADSSQELNFVFRIQRSNGRAVKSLMRSDTKAFAILYESVESCNLMDALDHGISFQKSPDGFRGLGRKRPNLKSWFIVAHAEMCGVKSFKVRFEDIGFQGIIAPEEIDIGICGGFCTTRNAKTGYAFLKNIYEKFDGYQSSTCQPTGFGGTGMIYIDPTDGGLVITQFIDMVVTQCGCL